MNEDLDQHIFALGFPRWRDVTDRRSIAHHYGGRGRGGVYVLGFANGERYVGRAKDVTRRYVQHRITHPDIVNFTFKPVPEDQVAAEERRCIHALERSGLKLRNLAEMSVVQGPRALDQVLSTAEQEAWLAGENRGLDSSARPVDEDLRRRLHRRFDRLLQREHAANALKILGTYLTVAIPYPNRTELTFWATSCLPSEHVYTRVNVNMQEVLTLFEDSGKLRASFHLAISPFERKYGAAWKAHLVRSTVVSDHYYKPGGGDQFCLEASAYRAWTVLRDPTALEAMSTLNLRLMRKGPNFWSTSHCIDLVTAAYESANR